VSTFSALSSATSPMPFSSRRACSPSLPGSEQGTFCCGDAVPFPHFPLGSPEVLPGASYSEDCCWSGSCTSYPSNFLYAGRLAAYVFLIDQPMAVPVPQSEDDILSDIPGLIPEPY